MFHDYVGIDVAKDKHDCFITNSDGEVLYKPFTIQNNGEGFDKLYERIRSVSNDFSKVKVGLESTGHYSYNIQGYLVKRGSRSLRYALFNATKLVCMYDPKFREYLNKKRAEGKHYNVAISHATKKLVRLIYALETSGRQYITA